MDRTKIALIVIAVLLLPVSGSACLIFWLERPARATVHLPADLSERAQPVRFGTDHRIRGWWIVSSDQRAPTVILMHGVRSNRISMVDRARFLTKAGYNVLLFDFQAHGESAGDRITFGDLESEDAQEAVRFVRERSSAPVGVIGSSLGGAAALNAEPALEIEAAVLEAVYPSIEEAFSNRLQIVLGPQAEYLAGPALWLMQPFSRIDLDRLQPLKQMQAIQYPVLFLSGSSDDRTTIEQARRFSVFPTVTFHEVDGAGHVDLHRYAAEQYEQWVLEFFRRYLHPGD